MEIDVCTFFLVPGLISILIWYLILERFQALMSGTVKTFQWVE
jgi:hypothetical protein